MNIADKLRELSKNLYWAWHPEFIRVFRDIQPELWREVNHNPVEFLQRLADQAVEDTYRDPRMSNRLTQAFHKLHGYLEASEVWGAWHAGPLRPSRSPISPPSSDCTSRCRSIPAVSASWRGTISRPPPTWAFRWWRSAWPTPTATSTSLSTPAAGSMSTTSPRSEEALPLELVKNEYGQPVRIAVRTEPYEIWVGIWQVRVGRNLLLLLDTNVDGNSDEDKALTSRLYGGDRRTRILQELILGVGGMRALRELGVIPGVIHLNEGHSAFAILELARTLMERDGQSFYNVRELAAGMTVFTTHTAVPAGHDVFEPALVEQALGPLRQQLGLSQEDLLALGRLGPEQRCRALLDDDPRIQDVALSQRGLLPARAPDEGHLVSPLARHAPASGPHQLHHQRGPRGYVAVGADGGPVHPIPRPELESGRPRRFLPE